MQCIDVEGEECLREGGLCNIDMEMHEAEGVAQGKKDGITMTPVQWYIPIYQVIITYEKSSEYNH